MCDKQWVILRTVQVRKGCKSRGSIVTLFVVATEILAISLRSNEHIEGIKIDNDEIKTLLYADDMTATLANTSSVEIFMVLY